MKKLLLLLIVLIATVIQQPAKAQINAGISFNTFYTELEPYGRWIDYPAYGRVWLCNEHGFRPYYNSGHWEYTDWGWTWVSDYPWGWAPFHYGRWAYIPAYGWGWVPGYEWGPAWVGWCNSGDYYGWAPLSPGLSFNISYNSIPADRWVFVTQRYISSPSVYTHYVDNSRNPFIYRKVSFINNSRVSNNTHYIAGPERKEVERVTQTTIQPKPIEYSNAPGKPVISKQSVRLYRPDIKNNPTLPALKKDENNMTNPPANRKPVEGNISHLKQVPEKKQATLQPIKTEKDQPKVIRQQKFQRKTQIEQAEKIEQQKNSKDQQIQQQQQIQEQRQARELQQQKINKDQQIQLQQQRLEQQKQAQELQQQKNNSEQQMQLQQQRQEQQRQTQELQQQRVNGEQQIQLQQQKQEQQRQAQELQQQRVNREQQIQLQQQRQEQQQRINREQEQQQQKQQEQPMNNNPEPRQRPIRRR